jgi:hypothetical protein
VSSFLEDFSPELDAKARRRAGTRRAAAFTVCLRVFG